MDPAVLAAQQRWPDVPAVFGWLSLDARGRWRLHAEGGAHRQPHLPGEPIGNAGLRAFIDRNYGVDARGRWFFQNGPQRVYVELECTPWIARLRFAAAAGTLHVHTHTGAALAPRAVRHCLLDEHGRIYLAAAGVPGAPADRAVLGLVHSQDVLDAAQALECGMLPAYEDVLSADLPQRFGFVRSPQAWDGVA